MGEPVSRVSHASSGSAALQFPQALRAAQTGIPARAGAAAAAASSGAGLSTPALQETEGDPHPGLLGHGSVDREVPDLLPDLRGRERHPLLQHRLHRDSALMEPEAGVPALSPWLWPVAAPPRVREGAWSLAGLAEPWSRGLRGPIAAILIGALPL